MIEVRDLIAGYNKGFILKSINLKIQDGEFVAIIGPNGSGKTTLFRTLTKVLAPKDGSVFFDNIDIKKIGYARLAKELAVVSQDIDAIPHGFSVEEYVLLGRIPHRKRLQFLDSKHDFQVSEDAMELTGIKKFMNRSLEELSGGERQRVFVSRAICQEPKTLLLDEPTTHLDIGHQIELLELLKQLNKNKKLTIVIILHDLNLASCYCDRLILMDEGKIYNEGIPQKVLTYQNIEKVYKTVVVVEESPLTGKPYVFAIPKDSRKLRSLENG